MVSSLVGMVLLPILLERGMFYEQFRCNIMIDGITFQANIHVHNIKGCLYINLYSTWGEFPV